MEGRDAPLWRCPRLPPPEARSPPRRADWAVRIQVPVREGGAGSSSSAAAHRGAPTAPLSPGRAVGSVAVGAQPGTAPALPGPRSGCAGRPGGPPTAPALPGPRCPVEAVGVDPRRAGVAGATPPPPPHPGARPDRGARWWTSSECYCGPGSGRSRRASRLNADARGWVRRLGRGQLGGASRFNAGAGGSVAERPDHSKRWPARIFHPPRPALLPSRSGAMTPFLMSAGAAAHPKDMRRPPFSAPPTPRAATAGPPEASTAPGPSSTPARTATAGAASRSPRGNHRTAPGPARISRIRADAESAAPARGVAGAAWPASASRRSAALGPGASRPDPGPRSIPIRSGQSARTSHNPRERLPGVRSRGLLGDLAGQATISRRAVRAVRLPRGSSPTARTRGAAGSVPPDLVREADAEDGVGEVIPIRCPTSSVRPTRTSAPTPGRGPARARRRDSGDQVAGLGAPRTRTGTATGPGPDSAPDPRHHGRTGEPPAVDSGPARTRLAGPEARLGRGWFA